MLRNPLNYKEWKKQSYFDYPGEGEGVGWITKPPLPGNSLKTDDL